MSVAATQNISRPAFHRRLGQRVVVVIASVAIAASLAACAARRDAVLDTDAKLSRVELVHGGAGPWAVAGYRMGEHALGVLGLERGSADLEVVHYTPHEVQYSCIADGASAATGASLGKLNLSLADAAAPDTRTIYRRKSTGRAIALRVTAAFAVRFTNVPPEGLRAAGREAIELPDSAIFETIP